MSRIDQRAMDMILEMRRDNEISAAAQDEGLRYALKSVEQISIPAEGRDIPAIVYTPDNPTGKALPAYINIHGGGFIMARAYMDGPYCRRIANRAQCVVVNVDYRLAPEHPYPAALNDCYDAALWTYTHADELNIDRARIAIGGYSAGGNLSAAVCLLARERGKPALCQQTLCYPPLDITSEDKPLPPECEPFPKEIETLFNASYLGESGDPYDPLISPLYAGSLAGLPPALIIVGSRDGLFLSSDTYARLLKEAGVPVTYKVYAGMGHAFTHTPCPEAEDAWELICAELQKAFYGGCLRAR